MIDRDRLQTLFTAILVGCAVCVTALFVRREVFAERGPPPAARAPSVERRWRSFVVGDHRAGPPTAAVSIVEFSDFQCPFCRIMAVRLDSLRQEYPNDVQVVYRHYPLARHTAAIAAARSSDCAGEQGRFWPMHDALFGTQPDIGRKPWRVFAQQAGVPDLPRFDRCMGRTDDEALARDTAAANRLEVSGTPTLLVNDQLLPGAAPLDVLRAAVDRSLRTR